MSKKVSDSESQANKGHWKPVGQRLLVQSDPNRKVTKGGIALPDNTSIPQLTGIVMDIGIELEDGPDAYKCPIKVFDKIIYKQANAHPLDVESHVISGEVDGALYIVPLEAVLAVFKVDD